MKKTITKITTLALALFTYTAFSQEKIQPCNTFEAMEQAFANNPEARKNYEAAQEQLRLQQVQSETNLAGRPAAAFEYTVPIVFHVLYECNSPLISDATIIQALKEVNDDYARNNADTNLIATQFKNGYIDSDIKFVLAKKDPSGNCINGIVRHENAKTRWNQGIANLNNAIGSAYWQYTWDPTKYLNVYVVAEIIPQGTVTGGGIIVGYTYRPGTWPTGNPHDAIVYNLSYLSGGGNAPRSRSLSHEIGHWLSLAHTFGNTNNPGINCGDDNIGDTPITKGEFGGCATSTVNSCAQSNPALTGLNNVQNIMNYSDCPRNFTTGQTTNMRNTLAATVNGRNNLYTPSTLAFTDVNGSGLCNPVTEFYSSNCSYTVCKGSSLTFRDQSNSGITSLAWSANNGGTAATPSSTLTAIVFPNVGTSDVTLMTMNAQGTNSKVKTVTVIDNTPGFGPIQFESFESPGIPANWAVINSNNDQVQWSQTGAAAYDGSSSYMIAGANNPAGNSDILQMPVMDVLNNQSDILEFAYSYRQKSSSQNDMLIVEGSKDCGGTWQTIFSMSAAFMQAGTGGIDAADFYPTSEEWRKTVLSSRPQWQTFKSSSNVLVRFNFIEGTSGFGNNMFVDAINWYNTVGINELTKSIRFNMYPNPTTGESNLSFNLNDPSTIKVNVVDVMGREVLALTENKYNAGEQTIIINKDNTLAKGVYFVNLSLNGAKMSRKLIIN